MLLTTRAASAPVSRVEQGFHVLLAVAAFAGGEIEFDAAVARGLSDRFGGSRTERRTAEAGMQDHAGGVDDAARRGGDQRRDLAGDRRGEFIVRERGLARGNTFAGGGESIADDSDQNFRANRAGQLRQAGMRQQRVHSRQLAAWILGQGHRSETRFHGDADAGEGLHLTADAVGATQAAAFAAIEDTEAVAAATDDHGGFGEGPVLAFAALQGVVRAEFIADVSDSGPPSVQPSATS